MVSKTITVAVVLGLVVLALVPLPFQDRTRITNTIVIARPPDTVFAYVTTPRNWPKWHPVSKAVSGATYHSLALGEKVTEDFAVAGHAGKVVWTVIKRDPPPEWIIEGDVDDHNAGTVAYWLTPVAEGTRFERELIYPARNFLFAILNQISIKSRSSKNRIRLCTTSSAYWRARRSKAGSVPDQPSESADCNGLRQ